MILPALKTRPRWLRLPERKDFKHPLPWLILLALVSVFLGVTIMALVAFRLTSPEVSRYGGDVAARNRADYGFWPFGALLPPLNPEAASASEQDQVAPPDPEGDGPSSVTAVAVVVVAATTPTPTPPLVTAVPAASPTNVAVVVVEAPSPSPTSTAVPQRAPTQPTLATSPPRATVVPSATATTIPVMRPDQPAAPPPAPPTSTPAPPTSTPVPSATTSTTAPTSTPVPSATPTPVPPPATSTPEPSGPPTSTPTPSATPEPAQPVLSFVNAELTAREEDGRAVFTLRLNGDLSRTVTVQYSTGGGTATAGVDYRATSGTLTFAPGETLKDVVIELLRDNRSEPAETVELRLGTVVNADPLGSIVGYLTIVDSDPPPSVRFVGASRTIAESVGSVGLTFALSAPSGSTVEAPYTVGGTAELNDHSLRGGTVIFPPNVTTMRLRFDIVDDAVDEDDETIIVGMDAPVNATLGSPSSYTLTIADDDTAAVNLSRASFALTEAQTGGHTSAYLVTLNSQPTHPVTVAISPDAQLTAAPARITFQPGDWNQPRTVTIFVVDDDIDEPNLHLGYITHSITSSDPRYNQIATPPAIVTISDNDTAGITLTLASTSLEESAANNRHRTTYRVALTSQPIAPVTVTVDTSATPHLAVSPAQVIFAPETWRTPQTVTVTTVQNEIDQGASYPATLSHTAASADPNYADPGAPFAPRVLSFMITDDDTAGLVRTPSGALSLNEGGTTSYMLRLTSQPLADVTVTLSHAIIATAGMTLTPTSLTFTPANWQTAQPIRLAVAENLVDQVDPYQATISHNFSSTDPNYNDPTSPFAPYSFVVTVIDNDTAGITRTLVGATSFTEGGSSNYTLRLTSEPLQDVTITLAPSVAGVLDLSATSLAFTPANWADVQTITLNTTDNAIDDGNRSTTISHTVISADPLYAAQTVANLTISVLDDDTAGITRALLGLISFTEGGSSSYTLRLTSEPLQDVTITLAPSVAGVLDLSTTSLTFTPANWADVQTITLNTTDNAIDDGNRSTTISHTVISADPLYAAQTVANLTITVLDDDTAEITRTLVGPTSFTEGDSSSYTLRLTSEPLEDVTITLVPSVAGVLDLSTTSLTFTPANWADVQTITLNTTDNAIDDGNRSTTISHAVASLDPLYATQTVANLTITVLDDDTAEITRTLVGLTSFTEGDSSSYTLRLTSEPLEDVTITLVPSVAGVLDLSTTSLTFTPANWADVQTITLNTTDNAIDDGNRSTTISHTVASLDPLYATQTVANLAITVLDDETAEITRTLVGLTSFTEGDSSSYTLRLTSEPLEDVTITLAAGPAGVATLSPASLTFTSANWADVQTVTVSTTDNAIATGNRPVTISHTVASLDPLYATQTVANLVITVLDDDTAGITRALLGPTNFIEGGATSYTLRLTSEPLQDVTITLAAGPAGVATLSPASLTFTSANWADVQTVTVSTTGNAIATGNRPVTISHTVASLDPTYAAQTVTNLAITVLDNDTAGITRALLGPTSFIEGGATSYTLRLTSEPLQDVTITLAAGPAGVATLSPASLTFTSANWADVQTITVSTTENAIATGNRPVTISHTVASLDPTYAAQTVTNLTITVLDNDTAGITITPLTLDLRETGETSGSFSVRLTSEPITSVTLTLSQDGQLRTLSPPTLVFDASNWSTALPISVQALDDAIDEGGFHTSTIQLTGSGDAAYGQSWTYTGVRIEDNDTAGLVVSTPDGTLTSEAGTSVRVVVQLASQPRAPVTVSVTSSDLSEGAVSVAAPESLPLVFDEDDWDIPVAVTVTGVDDAIYDGQQPYTITVAVTGSADPIYAALAPVATLFTNNDNERAWISVGDATTQPESFALMRFPISISEPPLGLVEVDYETVSLSAQAGQDFTGTTGTFSFTPTLPTSGFIQVPIVNDGLYEADELLAVRLTAIRVTAVDQVDLRDRQGVGTILNDDVPAVRFRVADLAVARGSGQTVPIEVVLDAPLAVNARVTYTTYDIDPLKGTADPGSDYTPAGYTLNFIAGETSQTFNLEILDNAGTNALTETVRIALSNPINVMPRDPQVMTVTIYDLPLGDPLVPAEPPLELSLSIGAPVAGPPTTLPLSLSYANVGPATALSTVVTVSLPSELVPTTATCALAGVTCVALGSEYALVLNLGDLAAGSSGTLALEASLRDDVGGLIAVAAEAVYRDTASVEYRKRSVATTTLP